MQDRDAFVFFFIRTRYLIIIFNTHNSRIHVYVYFNFEIILYWSGLLIFFNYRLLLIGEHHDGHFIWTVNRCYWLLFMRCLLSIFLWRLLILVKVLFTSIKDLYYNYSYVLFLAILILSSKFLHISILCIVLKNEYIKNANFLSNCLEKKNYQYRWMHQKFSTEWKHNR